MSYRVTVEELRKGEPPLRLISVTALDWLEAVDRSVAELSKEDSYLQNGNDEDEGYEL